MFNANSQVANALKIFTKAEAKLEQAIAKADEEITKSQQAIDKKTEELNRLCAQKELQIEASHDAKLRAKSALEKIKLILGGE
jgi:molybdopterin-biosynthesis enzyme MoeA-like protein